MPRNFRKIIDFCFRSAVSAGTSADGADNAFILAHRWFRSIFKPPNRGLCATDDNDVITLKLIGVGIGTAAAATPGRARFTCLDRVVLASLWDDETTSRGGRRRQSPPRDLFFFFIIILFGLDTMFNSRLGFRRLKKMTEILNTEAVKGFRRRRGIVRYLPRTYRVRNGCYGCCPLL